MKLLKRMVPRKDDGPPGMVEALESPSASEITPSTPASTMSSPSNHSMATGSFSAQGSVRTFAESPKKSSTRSFSSSEEPEDSEQHKFNKAPKSPNKRGSSLMTLLKESSERIVSPVVFRRLKSSFLRVADLQMDENLSFASTSDGADSSDEFPNFHCISVHPPPGVTEDPKERWVALDDGDGRHAPIAPFAIRALARAGLSSTFDESMWAPDSKTAKLLKNPKGWQQCVWNQDGYICLPTECSSAYESQILVWMGSFKHNHYGSDLPAVRAAGVIDMPPEDLLDLLVDSSRVKEYNKLSLGRKDLLVLQEDMHKDGPFGGCTKVIVSESKPPMVRKTMKFTSILHARELDDASGFKIVSRAVTHPEDQDSINLKSEILMGVNLIKRVKGNANQCLMINVNHIRSPMVPTMIAKRIGLQAASNFINDLRACC